MPKYIILKISTTFAIEIKYNNMGLNLGNYYDNVTSNAVTSGKYSSQDDVIRKALNPS
ncbi:MAG: hypothetical protein LBQ31_09200 [Bacteroidales bacterium]|nr:hypothetical protein [Bacteroidales bacterium]